MPPGGLGRSGVTLAKQAAGFRPFCTGRAKGVQRVAPERVEHRNVWGFGGLPLDFPRLSSHIGKAARKRGERGSGGVSLREAVGRLGNFGLLQSVKKWI